VEYKKSKIMQKIGLILIFLFFVISCKKSTIPADQLPVQEPYYYPPIAADVWESKSIQKLGWDSALLQNAFDYAGTKSTYGLLILQNGRMVKEQYWNNWTKDTRYYLASAGKSVVAFLAGIAQEENLLNINEKTSQYLGLGWTSLSPDKENLITLKNQLTMTTGLDDEVPNDDCTDDTCLIYRADAGSRWAYHNAPYLLLHNVLTNATGKTLNQYSKEKLFDKIGMSQSIWYNGTMWCTTREAARFGSLIINKGKWNGISLLNDSAYFEAMTTSSQSLNNSYGYLWWFNGKSSFMLPTTQMTFPGYLVPNAPSDMIMALGKDDKKIYIVPSLNVVVVRLGDAAGGVTLGPSGFDNEFWRMMKLAIGY